MVYEHDHAALACPTCVVRDDVPLRYKCPRCSAAMPDSHTLRVALQCQHALWYALVGQQVQQAQQKREQSKPQSEK